MISFSKSVALVLRLSQQQVEAVLQLVAEGATIPFIARYRKDKTGALDEVMIQQIIDEATFQKDFSERKAFIEKTITDQEKMTPALQEKINAASSLAELEDIYLPYKPKRKTKAQTAREQGLEPLALALQEQSAGNVQELAQPFINDSVVSEEAALQGARDILAEWINEDAL
ncbi:MAG: Tex-like N-terminal domain-containing protein, partial [Bacteroidota bacterium]